MNRDAAHVPTEDPAVAEKLFFMMSEEMAT
jgi:hypothetical protein